MVMQPFQTPHLPSREGHNVTRVLVTVAAEVFLVSAVVLLAFVFLQLPVQIATAACLFAFFAGSIFCWKSFAYAQTLLLLSLAAMQVMMLTYIGWLLVPFVLVDIGVLFAFTRFWSSEAAAE